MCPAPSQKQRKQFYSISLGSFKEIRAIMQLYPKQTETITADMLGAHLYKLWKNT